MKSYPVFLVVAMATVFSPGPGVVMTLSNSLRYGLKGAFGGILGISLGALVIAAVSATSLGLLLATSALAFAILKYIGAAYLAYLGIKLWRAPAFQFTEQTAREANFRCNFFKGMTLQFSNPKAIFFFLSVLPQFIDRKIDFAGQFTLMAMTYGLLIIVIHSLYAIGAQRMRLWLTSEMGGLVINKVAGTIFMFFCVTLAFATS